MHYSLAALSYGKAARAIVALWMQCCWRILSGSKPRDQIVDLGAGNGAIALMLAPSIPARGLSVWRFNRR